MNQARKSRRRTPDEIFTDAIAKVERARLRRASHLNVGERRRSLTRIPSLAGHTHLRSLKLLWTGVTDLAPLAEVPWLEHLDLTGTPVWDLSPLTCLKSLKSLSLSRSSVIDLSPLAALSRLEVLELRGIRLNDISPLSMRSLRTIDLTECVISDFLPLASLTKLKNLYLGHTNIVSLDTLSGLTELTRLALINTRVSHLSPIRYLKELAYLDLENTLVSDIAPLSSLTKLRHLDISKTPVTHISALSSLTMLETLVLDNAPIKDLSVLAHAKSLAAYSKRLPYWTNLSYRGCPLLDKQLHALAALDRSERTIKVISYLREQQGLTPLSASDYETRETEELPPLSTALQPVENVSSAFSFQLAHTGTISLVSGPVNWPVFPHNTSERDHSNRLDVCRTLADDLVSDLEKGKFQAREEYATGLQRYAARLPTRPGDGNILMADAEARTLRNLFASEADILSPAFASKLKTFWSNISVFGCFIPR